MGEPYAHVHRELRTTIQELVGRSELGAGARVVDVGCGDREHRDLLPPNCEHVDVDGTATLADESAQAVLSIDVLDHVKDPARHLSECRRVLAPGGKLVLSAHGLMVSNGDPVDRWRWTGEGLRSLVRDTGFNIIEFRGLLGLAATGAQLFQLATAPRLPRGVARLYTASMQRVVAWLDGRSPSSTRTDNALILTLLAEKPVPGKIERVTAAFGEARPTATFLQIGANDGEQRDPLRGEILRRQWTGMLVEPLPFVFDRLRRNYEGIDRVRLLNVAVADRDGVRPLFHLAQSDDPWLPRWYDALGSFRREVVLRHRDFIPDIEERVTTTDVPCVTPDTLLDRFGPGPVDIVQVDTEGYDYEILRRFPFDRAQPTLVIYEHHHLADDERAACQALLHDHGFELFEESLDTVALHVERAAATRDLLDVWTRVRP